MLQYIKGENSQAIWGKIRWLDFSEIIFQLYLALFKDILVYIFQVVLYTELQERAEKE